MQAFGPLLKDWRAVRRMSQLDLALEAEISARHLSFVETGRAQPSRDMVLRLADSLHLPQGATNALLAAAGYAAAFPARDLSEAAMAPLRAAMDWMLERHAPYPGFALDRHWRLVALNGPARVLLQASGIEVGDSLLVALLDNEVFRSRIENLDEVEQMTLHRLRSEMVQVGSDPVLEAHIATLQVRQRGAVRPNPMPSVISARYRMGTVGLSFFSTIAQFGTVEDVTLSELRIECLFPADEGTRAALIAMASDA